MHAIDQIMTEAVQDGVFPAAEILIAKSGEIRHAAHYGKATPGVLFDIASLTKPFATGTRAMQLVASGRLKLSTPAAEFLPELAQGPHGAITVQQLLSHRAGLAAWQPFYMHIPQHEVGTEHGHRTLLQAVLAEPPAYAMGSECRYSDLGYILLGEMLERIDGRGLEVQCEAEIARPLGMSNTFFRPLEQSGRPPAVNVANRTYAATEDCPWRERVLCGEVHDQNCFAMGGVAGHAGLFSCCDDLHAFLHQLQSCWRGHSDWIHQEIVREFLDFTQVGAVANASHLCGWDTPGSTNSQAGRHFSASTIGHLGYTGCSCWCDLQHDWEVILLTNRVHPSTTNEKIKAFRPYLHDAIYAILFA